jgi:hypothetical protein
VHVVLGMVVTDEGARTRSHWGALWGRITCGKWCGYLIGDSVQRIARVHSKGGAVGVKSVVTPSVPLAAGGSGYVLAFRLLVRISEAVVRIFIAQHRILTLGADGERSGE